MHCSNFGRNILQQDPDKSKPPDISSSFEKKLLEKKKKNNKKNKAGSSQIGPGPVFGGRHKLSTGLKPAAVL